MDLSKQIITSIITSSAVSGLLIFLFKTYLSEKIKSNIKSEYDRKLEDFKSKIKQIEYVRNNKYEALKELNTIYYKIYPEKQHPFMEWDDALGVIANRFDSHETLLRKFLENYSHILDKEIISLIEEGMYSCSNGKFEDEYNQLKYAEKLFNSVKDAKDNLFKNLNNYV